MSSGPETPAYVDHPLWSRFLRWSTIRPKQHERPRSANLVATSSDDSARLESLDNYEYTPLPDPDSFIRLATLLPGEFDDEIRIRLDHHVLKPPSRRRPKRLTLADIRRDLPASWEAFQTIVDNLYFFRNIETGHIQWSHPEPGFHIEKYEVPPRNDGVVPLYETVSYVWGNTEKSEIIKVDRPNGPAKLRVTPSLSTVLRYLRYAGQTRTLWIDAICLDQDHNAELRHQIPRMSDVYGLAQMSTLWLGTEDHDSNNTLEMFHYLGTQVLAEADTGLLFCSPNATEKEWYDPEYELPLTQDTWDGIRMLLQRPWFHRVWVVQEIQPGAVVQCGHVRVPVAAFTEAIYCLYSKAKLPCGLRPRLEQATRTLARLPALCFTRLLYRVATFKACTDPRDKIYGLLGLAPRKFAMRVKVGYEENNTATDVYAMTFLLHADIALRLEHFHNCFTGREATARAPSWVPDWYSDIPGETYIPAQFATNTSRAHYSVSYSNRTNSNDKSRPEVLQVCGVRCGEVSRISEPLPAGLEKREAIHRVRLWQPDDLDTSTYKPTSESTRKAYAITLICNILKEREPDWILSSTDQWVEQDLGDQALFGKDAASSDSTQEIPSVAMRSDVSDALQCCADRLFFRTHEGHMGLAPADTQTSDVLAIFMGCSTPLILRPSSRSTNHFSVIGECFVHGLHDATVLLGPLPQPWTGITAWVDGDRRCLRFLNTETAEVTREDPRLEPLTEWERTEKLVDGDDPTLYDFFRHKKTGELINYDPRLEPEKLKVKGVRFDLFSLI